MIVVGRRVVLDCTFERVVKHGVAIDAELPGDYRLAGVDDTKFVFFLL